jgi:UDP-N-acetyl-D-galactosamine dehydrogenase
VGGHCIGVDPYYLAEKAIQVGYTPEIILAGRRMNDSMGAYVAQETVKLMVAKGTVIKKASVLILGMTFKENCPDIRNSRVIDIINEFKSFSLNVDVYDPWASGEAVKKEYDLDLITELGLLNKNYDAVVLAVAHHEFLAFDLDAVKGKKAVVFDVKSQLKRNQVDGRL